MKNQNITIAISILIILMLSIQRTGAEKYMGGGSSYINQQTWNVVAQDLGGPFLIHWAVPHITWHLNSNGAGEVSFTDTHNAVSLAFSEWESVSTSSISFSSATEGTDSTWANDGDNVLFWAERGDPAYHLAGPLYNSTSTLAVTVVVYNSDRELLDVDIVFNGKDHPWNLTGNEGPDIQAVATHEIGHMLGLAHTENTSYPRPVMYFAYNGIYDRELKYDDEVGASFLYGGNILQNTNLTNPTNFFYWDVTVPNGVSLTFSSAVNTLKIKEGKKITINGTINASNISFEALNSSWSGIYVSGSNSSATINNCVIENAYKGIDINQAYANINNTDFVDCNYGLYLYRTNYASTQPDITNCNVYKSSYNSSGVGIYCKYSSPIILNTEVYNYYTGIGTIYNSSPLLGHYTANGNNYLHNNYKNLHAISSSNPFLGTTSFGGYNTLQYYYNYNIIAQTNCNIYAENNYWGSTNSSTIANGINAYSGCSVDYEPFLYWNPNESAALPPVTLSKIEKSNMSSVAADFKSVQELILSNKLEEALTICNSMIVESKESHVILYAIDLLWQIERKLKQQKGKENVDLFAQLRNESKNELVVGYINLIEAVGQQSSRITSLDNVLSNYGSLDIIEKGVFYSKFLYYINEERNKEKAEEQYKLLKEKYPDDPITEETLFVLNGGSLLKKQNEFNSKSLSNSDENPTDYALLMNYPNPFNPTTTISYQLKETGFVNLIVYNSIGQEVAVLENQQREKGIYNISFNASDLPSGIYIYRLQAHTADGKGDFVDAKKMILMK